LDFDDAPPTDGQPSGLAATEVLSSTPAAANLLAGTSSNPLDDLVSIFGGMSAGASVNGGIGSGGLGGLSFGSPTSPQTNPSIAAGLVPAIASPLKPQQPQEDLLGLF
jgi:hypothetical protein